MVKLRGTKVRIAPAEAAPVWGYTMDLHYKPAGDCWLGGARRGGSAGPAASHCGHQASARRGPLLTAPRLASVQEQGCHDE